MYLIFFDKLDEDLHSLHMTVILLCYVFFLYIYMQIVAVIQLLDIIWKLHLQLRSWKIRLQRAAMRVCLKF